VPVEEDPRRGPAGRVLLDGAGRPVARYDAGVRDGISIADLFDREPGVTAEQAAAVVLAELRGMKIAGDEELGRALLAAGGRKLRHGHMYTHDFAHRPTHWDTPAGLRLTDIDRPAADLVPSRRAAYPPGHPDYADVPEDMEAELVSFLDGSQFGPPLRGSALAVTGDGTVAGGIILGTVAGGEPPAYGPWVIDVWRDPAYRGAGRALLARALALAPVQTLGLIVSEGNDGARRLYEALGFTLVSSAIVVQI
jgi:RimJ/RimL family protein N-acetyltransferase